MTALRSSSVHQLSSSFSIWIVPSQKSGAISLYSCCPTLGYQFTYIKLFALRFRRWKSSLRKLSSSIYRLSVFIVFTEYHFKIVGSILIFKHRLKPFFLKYIMHKALFLFWSWFDFNWWSFSSMHPKNWIHAFYKGMAYI